MSAVEIKEIALFLSEKIEFLKHAQTVSNLNQSTFLDILKEIDKVHLLLKDYIFYHKI